MTQEHTLFVSLSVVLILEIFQYFVIRKDHGDLFPPKVGFRLFYLLVGTCFVFLAIGYFSTSKRTQDKSSIWNVLLVLALWLMRPNTLEANEYGLTSYSWFGLRKRFIAWNEVASVTSEWDNDEDYNRLAPFVRSITVTVKSRKGKRMRLSYMHGGIRRFMQALQEHVPANAFAPGLRDWKP